MGGGRGLAGLRPRERVLLGAFAEALLPGSGSLPRAEGAGGVAVVGAIDSLLGLAPARTRLGARIAIAALALAAMPRRFERMSLARRQGLLQALEERPGGLRRELYGLLKSLVSVAYARDPGVQALIGVQARCEVDGGRVSEPVAPPLDPAAMRPPEEAERCDVVVIGSGAGGAAAARVLAEAGASVIVLEEGEHFDAASYPRDPIDALAALYRDGGLTACEGRPAIPLPVGRCVGGTTVVNSGTCLRPPADVLMRWRDEHGIAWATDLERELESVERDLQVQPVDPARAGRNAELCRNGAEAIGASNGPLPRNAPDVVCCGTCPAGCALDAKQAMHVSELPRAVAAGCVIRAGVRADRLLVQNGRATGVSCALTGGGSYEVRARAVVLAAGALGTPELLLSQGLAGSSGAIGRNLMIHPACWVGARYDEEVRGWDGVMQSWYVDEWSDRGLFLEATFTPFAFGAHWLPGTGRAFEERLERYGNVAVIGVHMSERSSRGKVGLAGGKLRLSYRLSEQDAAQIRFGIARAAEIHFAAGASEVFPQLLGVPALGPGDQWRVESTGLRAKDLRLEAFHPMGSARMGRNAATSVVSPSGEAHDVPGLYVTDASIFPTSLRVNPMLTIMACARRIAAGIGDRLS